MRAPKPASIPGHLLLAAIGQDPVLRERLMVAEPWDIGYGGYRFGEFPAGWGEWNDKYRDDVRRFWRGDGTVGTLATRLAGSSDIFAARHRRPSSSVNFIAAHDGFTLTDAVTFAEKHNEANGEDNRDGHDGEVSWAAGAGSGRDARALLATLMVSRGTPMLTMGDELGRSQKGNNNAYALDNETTWLDWDTADNALIAFVGRLCALRRDTPVLAEDRYLSGQTGPEGVPDVVWLAPHGGPMAGDDWHASPAIGMALTSGASRAVAWLNASQDSASIWLPEAGPARRWRRAILSDEASAPGSRRGDFCRLRPLEHASAVRRDLRRGGRWRRSARRRRRTRLARPPRRDGRHRTGLVGGLGQAHHRLARHQASASRGHGPAGDQPGRGERQL